MGAIPRKGQNIEDAAMYVKDKVSNIAHTTGEVYSQPTKILGANYSNKEDYIATGLGGVMLTKGAYDYYHRQSEEERKKR